MYQYNNAPSIGWVAGIAITDMTVELQDEGAGSLLPTWTFATTIHSLLVSPAGILCAGHGSIRDRHTADEPTGHPRPSGYKPRNGLNLL